VKFGIGELAVVHRRERKVAGEVSGKRNGKVEVNSRVKREVGGQVENSKKS
jgi:hypothetical protein